MSAGIPAVPRGVAHPADSGYSPWEHLSYLEGVSLAWHDVGPVGLTTFSDSTISLRRGLDEAERRSTLAHEIVHLERGAPLKAFPTAVEESLVSVTVAVRLVPAFVLAKLPELVAKHGSDAACAFLGIDRGTLRHALWIADGAALDEGASS